MSVHDRTDPKIDLPKGWPRLARSAILHAVALAHLVVTHVRAWCADSPLRRVRLATENERLRSEVAMLQEELRIKDSRREVRPSAARSATGRGPRSREVGTVRPPRLEVNET